MMLRGFVSHHDVRRAVKNQISAGDKVKRLAVDATLRAAAPYQRVRRNRAITEGLRERKVCALHLEMTDIQGASTPSLPLACKLGSGPGP